jgi:DNA polymerase III sliding clamp (beta) subunit (PCNA family)
VTTARVVALLRRTRMPLADIAAVLAAVDDPATVDRVLGAHMRRLEDSLTEARRQLSRVRSLLDDQEKSMSADSLSAITLSTADLAAAIDRVRFATGSDPDHPMLAGILWEVDEAAVRLVATDRFRMAVATAPATGARAAAAVLLPTLFVDELRGLLGGAGEVMLSVTSGEVAARVGDQTVTAAPLDLDFPAYRRLLRDTGTHQVPVEVAALAEALGAAERRAQTSKGRTYDVVRLGVSRAGELTVGADPDTSVELGVNPEFLLQALAASGSDQLVLDLDGPLAPLTLRLPDRGAENFSLLMPVRLDA